MTTHDIELINRIGAEQVRSAYANTTPGMSSTLVGSLLIGLIATISGTDGRFLIPAEARQFLMVGILGGFTTFSSFSLQTLTMVQHGHMAKAALNVGGSVVLCLIAVAAGYALGAAMSGTRS